MPECSGKMRGRILLTSPCHRHIYSWIVPLAVSFNSPKISNLLFIDWRPPVVPCGGFDRHFSYAQNVALPAERYSPLRLLFPPDILYLDVAHASPIVITVKIYSHPCTTLSPIAGDTCHHSVGSSRCACSSLLFHYQSPDTTQRHQTPMRSHSIPQHQCS